MTRKVEWFRTEPAYKGDQFTYYWQCPDCGKANARKERPEGIEACGKCDTRFLVKPQS